MVLLLLTCKFTNNIHHKKNVIVKQFVDCKFNLILYSKNIIIRAFFELLQPEAKPAVALKSEIFNADQEIDLRVYELYGLTEEEIKIVEQQ